MDSAAIFSYWANQSGVALSSQASCDIVMRIQSPRREIRNEVDQRPNQIQAIRLSAVYDRFVV
jgi:hypothetical protein